MNISSVFSQMAVLFLVLIVGFITGKLRVLPDGADKILSKLVIHVAMPFTILNSVLSVDLSMSRRDAAVFFALVSLSYLIFFLVAVPLACLLRAPLKDRGLYICLLVFSNVGFMGFPVVESLFGAETAFYVTLYNIPFNLLLFSVGILLVSGDRSQIRPRQIFLSTTLIASFLAIIVFVFNISLPAVLTKTVSLIGQVTTPCAMLIIGITLSQMSVKSVFTEKRLYPLIFVRLILIPGVVALISRLFTADTQMLGILTVLAAMPTGTAVVMFSLEYGGNDKLASKGVFLSTLLSMVTIPIVSFFTDKLLL
ncbi:MAG TPA: AEC family transporter [Papillibacter sp.]|nr:AEC family transporter [Papillibacter sp.]